MRRRINQLYDPVLTVHIAATRIPRLVYLLVANRPRRYGKEYSRIVYIGTTSHGVRRMAQSAAKRISEHSRQLHGLRRLDVFAIWAKSLKGRQTKRGMAHWRLLERALLLRFKEQYGEQPALNQTGQRMRERHEFDVFRKKTIDRLIARFT